MIISVPVSIGEVLDKISILNIKLKKIKDVEKLKLVELELSGLIKCSQEFLKDKIIVSLMKDLESINLKLWEIEDLIRDKEKLKQFDDVFIDLARSVYITNDMRFDIKNKINSLFDGLKEVKSYSNYL